MSDEAGKRLAAGPAAALVTLLAIGVGISLWLVRIKLNLEFDPSYESSCNLGATLNCDRVQTSDWSTAFGHPLALWGTATYLVLLTLVIFARRGGERGRDLLAAVVVIGAVACLHSAWLASISAFSIGAWCIFCMILYGVNASVTIVAALAFRRLAPLGDTLALATRGPVWVTGAAAGIGAMLLTVPAYHLVRGDMAEQRIALAKTQMAAVGLPEAAPTKPPADAQATEPPAADATEQAAPPETRRTVAAETAPAGVITHPRGFRYSEVVLRKGRSFFEVPVTEHDFILGPEDAPVTVVQFADFECGYCRVLSRNIKSLRKKYASDVRWVFKHFPLDNTCNKVMKGTQHPSACIAAKASNCAGLQGKFWPMHDKLYAVSLRINRVNLRRWAEEVGVADLAAWDRCMDGEQGHLKTTEDSRAGRFARIAGTPRTYINGHLVPGVVATEVFDYYLSAAIAKADSAPAPAATESQTQHDMVRVTHDKGGFWIDAFEASLDAKGRALSVSGAMPAEVSWYEARDACKKAGKRLCTAKEWLSACTGGTAVDNDKDGDLTDDAVEGTMFPYGPFHEGGRCNDDAGGKGRARATGSMKRCRSASGIFDQSGNLAEWAGQSEDEGWLLGTDFRWGAKATCMLRTRRFGLGYRNTTTGFRCCADTATAPPKTHAIRHDGHGQPGRVAPSFSVDDGKGGKLTEKSLQGKVTMVSFFASWCGPCRRELPDLQTFWTEHKKKGIHVLAIGVDKVAADSKRFIEEMKVTYDVGYDDKAIVMGAFGVRGMPTAFLVDRSGNIKRRLVGINAAKMAAFKQAALHLAESKP